MSMQIYEHIYDLSPPFFTHKWLIIYTLCCTVTKKKDQEKNLFKKI